MLRFLVATCLRALADRIDGEEEPLDLVCAPDEPSCHWCRTAALCDDHARETGRI